MKIRITESELRQIVNESVKRVLNEDNSNYGSRNINTSVYDSTDHEHEAQQQMRNNLRLRDKRANSPYFEEKLANRGSYQQAVQQSEKNYQNAQEAKALAKSMANNVINFYNMLVKYQNKGLLGRFFSSKPKFKDYGLNKYNLIQLKNAYNENSAAISSVNANIGRALYYFSKLGII